MGYDSVEQHREVFILSRDVLGLTISRMENNAMSSEMNDRNKVSALDSVCWSFKCQRLGSVIDGRIAQASDSDVEVG